MIFAVLSRSGLIIAKYRDLPVASRSIICRSRRLRQIIDLRGTDESRYFSQPCSIVNCVLNLSLKPKMWQFHVVISKKTARNFSKVRAARAARLFFLVPPLKLLIHVVDVEVIPMNIGCLSPTGHNNINGT